MRVEVLRPVVGRQQEFCIGNKGPLRFDIVVGLGQAILANPIRKVPIPIATMIKDQRLQLFAYLIIYMLLLGLLSGERCSRPDGVCCIVIKQTASDSAFAPLSRICVSLHDASMCSGRNRVTRRPGKTWQLKRAIRSQPLTAI